MINKRVLHFDDEPFIVSIISNGLKLYGWDITLVSEVEDLFRELKTNQYDVLIMNLMAPIPPLENKHVTFTQKEIDEMDGGMNTGLILTEKIWRMENYKNIPILFLSARRQPEEITQFQSDGHKCAYLRKPEQITIIDKKLTELLSK